MPTQPPSDSPSSSTSSSEHVSPLPASSSAPTPVGAVFRGGRVDAQRSRLTSLPVPLARKGATVFGLLGFILFLLTPFLPVTQTTASLSWPQNDTIESIQAPLIGQTPTTLDLTVPYAAIETMESQSDGIVVGTVPGQSKDASKRGLFVRVTTDTVDVLSRDIVLASASRDEVLAEAREARTNGSTGGGDSGNGIVVHAGADGVSAEFQGLSPARVIDDEKLRPTFTGVYSDVPLSASPELTQGLSLTADIDTRFTTSPTLLKSVLMLAGLVSWILALVCTHRLDVTDGRISLRLLPRHWLRVTPLDGIVLAVLGIWHLIGANTSDDGYILTMARVADQSGYMANYFRWFGVPESPFGSPYYDIIQAFSHVSTTSPWMRLPALLCVLLMWLLISREVIPRLGRGIAQRPMASWTAAGVLLVFYMSFDNGLRPEPFVAAMALLTWVLIERGLATGRLLPISCAVFTASIALSGNPTGLMAVAALLAGTRGIIRIVVRRRHRLGILPQLAPILASGTAVLLAVFGDQTLKSVLEATSVRAAIGPSLPWNNEFIRYYWLFLETADGGFPRRFPVLLLLFSLVLVTAYLLRNKSIPGAATGPTWRLVAVTYGTMFFMAFSPTKWTHHFGAYAGIAACLSALGAMAIGQMALRSTRNRTLVLASMLFLLALAGSGIFGWWWVSSYRIPWFDKPPQLAGIQFSTVALALAILALLVAGWQHFREDYVTTTAPKSHEGRNRLRFLAVMPLTAITWIVVVFFLAAFAKGAIAQYPAYSVSKGNLTALRGQPCQMADDVLVESAPSEGMLSPLPGERGETTRKSGQPAPRGPLYGPDSTGFTANGLPSDLSADPYVTNAGQANQDLDENQSIVVGDGSAGGTDGGTSTEKSANGSSAKLPFGLDQATTPVLGSYSTGNQVESELVTSWYGMPMTAGEADEAHPLLTFSAAGRIASHDITGAYVYGQQVLVEYGVVNPDATPGSEDAVTMLGAFEPFDIGPAPSWRNLRVPLADLPPEVNAVRIHVRDTNLSPDQWVAITPPRMPELHTLQTVVGSTDPVFLDWPVGLQFPCQQPFLHSHGVMEIAKWRITPDRPLRVSGSDTWSAYDNGGLVGLMESTAKAEAVPTYLRDAYKQDWGSLERYEPYTTRQDRGPAAAEVTLGTATRSGLWYPGPIRLGY